MNTELQIFKNEEFGEVRTVEENGQIYFCGSDVAKALGYARPNDAINTHCRATVKRSTPISGKIQEINFIPEGDLYRLIVNSKLESAEKFEKWVFDEVLPTIRKTGSYTQHVSMEDIIIYQMSETKRIKQRQIEQQQQLNTVTTRLDGMKNVIELQFYPFEAYRETR